MAAAERDDRSTALNLLIDLQRPIPASGDPHLGIKVKEQGSVSLRLQPLSHLGGDRSIVAAVADEDGAHRSAPPASELRRHNQDDPGSSPTQARVIGRFGPVPRLNVEVGLQRAPRHRRGRYRMSSCSNTRFRRGGYSTAAEHRDLTQATAHRVRRTAPTPGTCSVNSARPDVAGDTASLGPPPTADRGGARAASGRRDAAVVASARNTTVRYR